MWKNYFKIAYRNLLRQKVNTFINVMSLTLGIAGALVIYTILHYESGFDAFHTNADQTYRVVHHNKTSDGMQYWNTTAYPLADALRQAFPELIVTQTSGPITAKLSSTKAENQLNYEEDKIWFVDPMYFDVFDYKGAYADGEIWIGGDQDKAFEHPNSVVLTLKAAKRYFGKVADTPANVIGQSLVLNEHASMMVSGIIQNPPLNSSMPFEILLPYEYFKGNNKSQAESWEGNHQGTTYLVIPPGTDPTQLTEKIATLKSQFLSKEDNERIAYHLQPLSEIHTETLYGSSPGSYVTSQSIINGLWLLAFVLILISCLNYINLATALSIKRAREVGIRKVLGSTKQQLFFQHMSEALLTSTLAFIAAFFIGNWVIGVINEIIDFATFEFPIDLEFYLLSIVLICATTFLAGGYPGIVMTQFTPIMALKNRLSLASGNGLSFRHSMIVFQFAIAQALIAGTLIMSNQMNFIQKKDLGYKKDDILSIKLQDLNTQKREAFRQSLLQIPAINQVSFSSGAPTTHERQYGSSFRLSHEPVEMRRGTELKFIDREYISLFQISLEAGQMMPFKDEYNLSDGLIVNENLVQNLGLTPEEAIGMDLLTNEGTASIIAVVKDFHNNALQEEIMPCIMVFGGSNFLDETNIGISENINYANLNDDIKASWQKVYPDEKMSIEFLNEKLDDFYRLENYLFQVLQVASGLAILIGCLGLYGLVLLAAQQRTKEIGIRKLVGASITGIITLLSWDFIKLILVAITLATPIIFLLMDDYLQRFAFRIDLEWWYFLGSGIITFTIALVTVSYQASKTALMNPVNALRSE
ncbi:ABC transporter permease [Anditalea andensis]|uniref:ABC transporter permease n=1 Tax=Anditalea andensis TaxID=1048983 RepID=A0A074KPK6_9BACT|nr:ABC transporter permease [Anditalea andensis]KEO71891.1 hypothetical protein EL17_20450 [Anditalea andensis]